MDDELCWSLDLFALAEGVGDIDTFELDLSSTRGREADDNDEGKLEVGVIVDGEGEGVIPLLLISVIVLGGFLLSFVLLPLLSSFIQLIPKCLIPWLISSVMVLHFRLIRNTFQ